MRLNSIILLSKTSAIFMMLSSRATAQSYSGGFYGRDTAPLPSVTNLDDTLPSNFKSLVNELDELLAYTINTCDRKTAFLLKNGSKNETSEDFKDAANFAGLLWQYAKKSQVAKGIDENTRFPSDDVGNDAMRAMGIDPTYHKGGLFRDMTLDKCFEEIKSAVSKLR